MTAPTRCPIRQSCACPSVNWPTFRSTGAKAEDRLKGRSPNLPIDPPQGQAGWTRLPNQKTAPGRQARRRFCLWEAIPHFTAFSVLPGEQVDRLPVRFGSNGDRLPVGILRDAMTERPVLKPCLDQVDENVFGTDADFAGQALGDPGEQRFLLVDAARIADD